MSRKNIRLSVALNTPDDLDDISRRLHDAVYDENSDLIKALRALCNYAKFETIGFHVKIVESVSAK